MPITAGIVSTFTAAFLGSFVEVVEAFTIILAVGVTQSWRPAIIGTGLALALLAVLVVIFGQTIALIPVQVVQYVIGTLLILFGMRWLRKAILRASGHIALHDETKAFADETSALKQRASDRRANFLAGVAAFKAVLLEGIEVVFIVLAVGSAPGRIGYASAGAAAACVVVLIAGVLLHKPLALIPENALKFVVGLLLTSFGIFWVGEGIGTHWPGEDLVLFPIFGALALFSFLLVRLARRPVAEMVK